MDEKIYYKVVREKDDRYFSCIVKDENRVEYIKDKWIRRNETSLDINYHLLVFDSFESAERFVKANFVDIQRWFKRFRYKIYIFKCRVKNISKKLPRRFETDYKCHIDNNNYYDSWCPNTVMAEEVMIYGEPIKIQ